MHNYNSYLPVIAAALVVVIFGCLNLDCFKQKKKDGSGPETSFANGVPNYLWLGLLALIAGVLVCMIQHQK